MNEPARRWSTIVQEWSAVRRALSSAGPFRGLSLGLGSGRPDARKAKIMFAFSKLADSISLRYRQQAAAGLVLVLLAPWLPATASTPAANDSAAGSPSSTPTPTPPAALAGGALTLSNNGTAHLVDNGVALDVAVEPLLPQRKASEYQEGDPVRVSLRFTDAATGQPLAGLLPAAWLDRIPAGEEEGPRACTKKIETFLGGSLLSAAEVNLNVFHLLTLNDDPSVSIIDPLLGFGGSKLLAMVDLVSPGEDWAITQDSAHLFVTQPDSGRLAIVDTHTWRQIAEHKDLGRPSRLLLQGDGRLLWIANDEAGESSGVIALDTKTMQVVTRIATGAGPHELAAAPDDRRLFVSNAATGTISVIDPQAGRKLSEVKVGDEVGSLAISPLAGALFAVDPKAGAIVVLDIATQTVRARIETDRGLGVLRVTPNGRIALVTVPEKNIVHVIDTVANRIVQTADVNEWPQEIAFSDTLAYVRHRDSAAVLVMPFETLGREGQPVNVIEFPSGQKPFGTSARPSPAPTIVQAPGDNAMLVANPADRTVYFYKEGMAAPMGSFKTYRRKPRAVLVVDRSLRSREAGVYQTTAELANPGQYDLAVFVGAPQVVKCVRFQVAADPELELARTRARGADVEFLDPPSTARVGESLLIRFRLSDPVSGTPSAGAKDVRVLWFLVPGTHHQRIDAEEIGNGIYEVEVSPSADGIYMLHVESSSLKLQLNYSPGLGITVEPAAIDDPSSQQLAGVDGGQP